MQRLREPDGPGKPPPADVRRGNTVVTPLVVAGARVLFLNAEGRVCHDVEHALPAVRIMEKGDTLELTISFTLEDESL